MNTARPLRHKHLLVFFAFTGIQILAGCGAPRRGDYPSPKEYDLNHPYKINLTDDLDEISGIQYYPKDTSVFSIADNSDFLFKIFLKHNSAVQKWKFSSSHNFEGIRFGKGKGRGHHGFGKGGHDYEDLQLIDSMFYVLSSSGDITRIRFYKAGDSLHTDIFKFPQAGNNEFESLYYDKASHTLNLLCKDCDADKKTSVSSWRFNLTTGAYELSPTLLTIAPIAKALGEEKIAFKASATAIHPITHNLYILSSVNKTLVIADTAGNVKEVYPLDPVLYKQPEGIAFTPAGDMLISNEVHEGEHATLLIFKHKNNSK